MHVKTVTKDQGPGICLGFYEHDHWLLYLIGGGKKGEKQNLKNFLPAQFPTNYIYSINGHLFATSSFFLSQSKHWLLHMREFKQRRRRRQRERQKNKRLRLAKQQFCTWNTHFCTFLCRRCTTTTRKCLISFFVENVNTRQRLSSSFSELRYSLLELNSKIWRIEWDRISAIKFETSQLHFLSDVFVAIAVVVA